MSFENVHAEKWISHTLRSLAFWEQKNADKRDAGMQAHGITGGHGTNATVDDEFEEMDEDGHRNHKRSL